MVNKEPLGIRGLLMSRLRLVLVCVLIGLALPYGALPLDVTIECPCTLQLDTENSAVVEFSLKNWTDKEFPVIYISLLATGQEDVEGEDPVVVEKVFESKLLGVGLEEKETKEGVQATFNFSDVPAGSYYLEILLHDESPIDTDNSFHPAVLDNRWFAGQTRLPTSDVTLSEVDYLTDSDGDGVSDTSEKVEGTDPMDAGDMPPTSVIDVLSLHVESSLLHAEVGLEGRLLHYYTVVNQYFEDSEIDLKVRLVGVVQVGEDDFSSELDVPTPLLAERRASLIDDYRPDAIILFNQYTPGLCGVAEDIGGYGGRGFMYPFDFALYAEVFHSLHQCGFSTLPHEIGHLIGLGHSAPQGARGTFAFSRGHGVLGEFATTMTYAANDFGAIEFGGFSNPELSCLNHSCGISAEHGFHEEAADSAKSVNASRFQVARRYSPNPDFDADGDGVSANLDVFPIDPNETQDSDGDGFGDNSDEFVDDPLEWRDTDGDGLGDNSDPDIDNDGVINSEDRFPFQSTLSQLASYQITSGGVDDGLGDRLVLIKDLDDDGSDSYLLTSPTWGDKTADPEEYFGRVHLFEGSALDEADELDGEKDRVIDVDHLSAPEDSYVLVGSKLEQRLGVNVLTSDTLNAEQDTSIVITSQYDSMYILDPTTLSELDAADGEADSTISINSCDQVADCIEISMPKPFRFDDVLILKDLDSDGIGEFLISGRTNSDEIAKANSDSYATHIISGKELLDIQPSGDTNSILLAEAWSQLDESYLLEYDEIGTEAGISFAIAGDVLGDGQEWLLVTFSTPDASAQNIWLVSTTNLWQALSESTTRIRQWHSMREPSDAFSFNFEQALRFGLSKGRFGHVTDDRREDFYVYSEILGYAIPGATVESLLRSDERFFTLDSEEFSSQVWIFNNTWEFTPRSRTVLATESSEFRTLVDNYFGAVMLSPLLDYAYLDDPDLIDINRIINLRARIELSDRFDLYSPLFSGAVGASRSLVRNVSAIGREGKPNVRDLGVTYEWLTPREATDSAVYFIAYQDLAILDSTDGSPDGAVLIQNAFGDTDGDGLHNFEDQDDDNDGVLDLYDRFGLDAYEAYDADQDGVGNNEDDFPVDYRYQFDIDDDGTPDQEDEDADGDGVFNTVDLFPFDTDNDGVMNRFDEDDDGDGVIDSLDHYPLNPEESADSDGDGYGDNLDAFDDDPSEWFDTDKDGIGNNTDTDDDGDGVSDGDDSFPLDPDEHEDTDKDGYGDNEDAFPNDPNEWRDSDGDGIGENAEWRELASVQIESDWVEVATSFTGLPFVLNPGTVHPYGDLDGTGSTSVGIFNPAPQRGTSVSYIVNIQDLSEIDGYDQDQDRLGAFSSIRHGTRSFELMTSAIEDTAMLPGNIVYSHEGMQPIVSIGLPSYTKPGLGSLFSVGDGMLIFLRGDELEATDSADSAMDGVIELDVCLTTPSCPHLVGNAQRVQLGRTATWILSRDSSSRVPDLLGGTALGNPLGSQTQSEVASSAYVLSGSDIEETQTTSADNQVDIDEVTTKQNSFVIYAPEGDGVWNPSSEVGGLFNPTTSEIDLLVSHTSPGNRETFILPRSQLSVLDDADGVVDSAIGLHNIHRAEGTWTIRGASLGDYRTGVNHVANSENRLVLFSDFENASLAAHLLTYDQLSALDGVDGAEDRSLDIDNIDEVDRTFTIQNIWDLQINPDVDLDSKRRFTVVGTLRGIGRGYIFTEDLFQEFDEVGGLDVDNTATFAALDLVSSDYLWTFTWPPTENFYQTIQLKSMGDVDGDGYSDYVGSYTEITAIDSPVARYRTKVFTLLYSELEFMDQFDGEQDNQIALDVAFKHRD